MRGPSCAPRPATPRRPPRPTGRPPGWTSSSSCRRARSPSASSSRRSWPARSVVAIDGNFDQALHIVRALAEQDDHPVTLVNSVNPFRLEGQKTAAFEICDDLGAAPDILAIPVGNAGNISAYWAGFDEYRAAGLRPDRPGDVGLPGRRGRAARRRPPDRPARDDRDRDPDRRPRVVGQGRRPRATPRAGASAPSPTTRSWPPTGRWPATRASSASRPRRRASPGSRRPPRPASWIPTRRSCAS